MKILIASTNPVKINSVKEAFTKFYPKQEFSFKGISVPSNVSDQPLSDKETYEGAKNRANNLKQYEADFYVGIEGGLEKTNEEYRCFAWVYIIKKNQTGKAKTSTFMLPQKFNQYLDKGMELGHVSDLIYNEKNTKQSIATIGYLTKGLITRTSYYIEAVILALTQFKG